MVFQIVIPARGGSMRFPKKNIADLSGKPLIAHTISFGLNNELGMEVFVNTDDKEITDIAAKYGAKVVARPSSLAEENTPTVDVLKHQIQYFEDSGIGCDAIVLLQATNPIRPDDLIEKAIKMFEISGRSSLCCFSHLNKKFGKIQSKRFIPENYSPGDRMQDLIPLFYENGLIYISKTEAIKSGNIITTDTFPFVINGIEGQVDIDDPEDILFAEFILRKQQRALL